MSDSERSRMKYLVLVNAMLALAVAFMHLLFLSPAFTERDTLAGKITSIGESVSESARKYGEYKKEKDSFRDDLDSVARAVNSGFATASVEVLQRSVSAAFASACPRASFDADYETRRVGVTEALFVRASVRQATIAEFFSALSAMRSKFNVVSESLSVDSPGSGEVAIRCQFYVPLGRLSLAGLKEAR